MLLRFIFSIFFLVFSVFASNNNLKIFTKNKTLARLWPSKGSVTFKVRARNDAYIVLAKEPVYRGENVRVLLGKSQNCQSEIHVDSSNTVIAQVDTPGLLSDDVFQDFWIKWECGIISVGQGGTAKPFLVAKHENLTHVSHIGYGTGWGSTGDWILENGDVLSTIDQEGVFVFVPNLNNEFEFQYKGKDSAIIGFQTDNNLKFEPLYKFRLGVTNNRTWISKNNSPRLRAYRQTTNLLNEHEYMKFKILLQDGHVILELDGDDDRKTIKWLDQDPKEINQIMLGNSEGHRSHWITQKCSLIDFEGHF